MNIRIHRLSLAASFMAIALPAIPAAAQTTATATTSTAVTQPFAAPVPPRPGYFGSMMVPLSKCKTCWKRSTLHKLLVNGMAPLNAATGGLIGGGHDEPPPVVIPLAPPPPPPAVSAAATIKLEAAQAEARVDAVRYLAHVDCHWYPEAEAALIASLRADRSECVRLAAAEALNRRCCCTKRTLLALQIAAAGSNVDGNPGERCPRVRWAALEALQSCLLQCDAHHFQQPAYDSRPETPEDPLAASAAATGQAKPALQPFYARVDAIAAERLLHDTQRIVAQLAPQQPHEGVAAASEPSRSLYGIWAATRSQPEASATASVSDESYAAAPASPSQPIASVPTGYPLARPLPNVPAYGGPSAVLPASAPIPVGSRPYEYIRQ